MLAQEWAACRPTTSMMAYGSSALQGEPKLAQDRYQDGQRDGQGESIMRSQEAVVYNRDKHHGCVARRIVDSEQHDNASDLALMLTLRHL